MFKYKTSVEYFTLKRKKNPNSKPKEADREKVPHINVSETIQFNCVKFPTTLNSQK